MHPPRIGDRCHRIDDDDRRDTVPILDQGKSVAVACEDSDRGRHTPAKPPGDRRPKAVVSAVWIADPSDERQRLLAAGHVRCTCNFKKCAAQEMHGSWLRMLCSQRAFSASSTRSRPAVATSRKSSSMTP